MTKKMYCIVILVPKRLMVHILCTRYLLYADRNLFLGLVSVLLLYLKPCTCSPTSVWSYKLSFVSFWTFVTQLVTSCHIWPPWPGSGFDLIFGLNIGEIVAGSYYVSQENNTHISKHQFEEINAFKGANLHHALFISLLVVRVGTGCFF